MYKRFIMCVFCGNIRMFCTVYQWNGVHKLLSTYLSTIQPTTYTYHDQYVIAIYVYWFCSTLLTMRYSVEIWYGLGFFGVKAYQFSMVRFNDDVVDDDGDMLSWCCFGKYVLLLVEYIYTLYKWNLFPSTSMCDCIGELRIKTKTINGI